MRVKCVECSKTKNLNKEEMNRLYSMFDEGVGKVTNLLELENIVSGKCGEGGKGHVFICHEDDILEVQNLIKSSDTEKLNFTNKETEEKEVDIKIRDLEAQLTELRLKKESIPKDKENIQLKIKEITERFEDLTGTVGTELWR